MVVQLRQIYFIIYYLDSFVLSVYHSERAIFPLTLMLHVVRLFYCAIHLQCFAFPGFFRIVLSIPNDKAVEACERLVQFCDRHYMHSVPEPLDSNGEPIPTITSTKVKKLPPPLNRITSDCYLLNPNKR